MGLRTFPGKFLVCVCVWSLVAIRAEMSTHFAFTHTQTHIHEWNYKLDWSGRVVWAVNTCSDLSKPVRTCPNLSAIQWRCTLSAQCLFCTFECSCSSVLGPILLKLHIAYFNLPNRDLSNGVRVMALYWNRNVYPSRSPCLETVDRKASSAVTF